MSEYIKVWRADSYLKTIKFTGVSADAPINSWLQPMIGEGEYIYTKTHSEAKAYLLIAIDEIMSNLEKTTDAIYALGGR